jgi:pantoate--beta-alanine ligase
LAQAQAQIIAAGFARIDYFELVDGDTLQPLPQLGANARLCAAAVMGRTRLIDNLAIGGV